MTTKTARRRAAGEGIIAPLPGGGRVKRRYKLISIVSRHVEFPRAKPVLEKPIVYRREIRQLKKGDPKPRYNSIED